MPDWSFEDPNDLPDYEDVVGSAEEEHNRSLSHTAYDNRNTLVTGATNQQESQQGPRQEPQQERSQQPRLSSQANLAREDREGAPSPEPGLYHQVRTSSYSSQLLIITLCLLEHLARAAAVGIRTERPFSTCRVHFDSSESPLI